MSHTKAAVAKKKRRVQAAREPPFPVPIATVTREPAVNDNWFYYTGELCDNHVVVKHSGDMDFLYKMGFFGKGTLSRSKPQVFTRARYVNVPLSSGETTTVRIMNRRSFVRHLNWRKRPPAEDVYKEYDSSEEQGSFTEKEELVSLATEDEQKEDKISNSFLENPGVVEEEWDKMDSDEEFWDDENVPSRETNEVHSKSEQDWTEADEDFWGCGSTSGLTQDCRETDPHAVEGNKMLRDDTENKSLHKLTARKDKETDISNDLSDMTDYKYTDQCRTQTENVKFSLDRRKSVTHQTTNSQSSDSNKMPCNEEKAISEDKQTTHDTQSSEGDKLFEDKEIVSTNQYDDNEKETECPVKESERSCSHKNITDEHNDEIPSGEELFKLDPLCEYDDDNGDVLVVDDSDSELTDTRSSQERWMPTLKVDPYNITEYLHLSLEEAFFLSFGLGCLVVSNQGEQMDICCLWKECLQRHQDFLPKYIAYHYFRGKGWVPKSGLKFGSDFILYKVGPPFYHGSYSVIVRMVDEDTLKDSPDMVRRTFSWVSLAGLNRATEHVAKELMFCFVIRPADMAPDHYQTPACIPRFKIQEVVVSRWVSSEEREKTAPEEMP